MCLFNGLGGAVIAMPQDIFYLKKKKKSPNFWDFDVPEESCPKFSL